MSINPCQQQREAVDAALRELEQVRSENKSRVSETTPNMRPTPALGSDLGSRFYESVSRHEAASRRYRAAVRALSECLRQQKQRAGVIDSAHD